MLSHDRATVLQHYNVIDSEGRRTAAPGRERNQASQLYRTTDLQRYRAIALPHFNAVVL